MSKREDKKEAILLAGMEAMKSHGYNGTSVNDIVGAAGVPKGSFYNYFESKEKFALDAIDYAADESRSYAQGVLGDKSMCPLVRIKTFFSSGVDCACEHNFTVGCFLGNMCQEMADTSDLIRQKLDLILNGNTRMIAAVIADAQESGVVDADMDAKTAAEFLFNAWEGALMRAKASKCRMPLDAFVTMLKRILG